MSETMPIALRMARDLEKRRLLRDDQSRSLVNRVRAITKERPGLTFTELAAALGTHEGRKINTHSLRDMVNRGRMAGVTYRTDKRIQRLYCREDLPTEEVPK